MVSAASFTLSKAFAPPEVKDPASPPRWLKHTDSGVPYWSVASDSFWYGLDSATANRINATSESDWVYVNVLYFHGNSCDIASSDPKTSSKPTVEQIIQAFPVFGGDGNVYMFRVTVFDYPGYGYHASRVVAASEAEVMASVDDAADVAFDATGQGPKVVNVAWGYSIGTGPATLFSTRLESCVDLLYLQAPPKSLVTCYPPEALGFLGVIANAAVYLGLDVFDTKKNVARVILNGTKVIVHQGRDDITVPFATNNAALWSMGDEEDVLSGMTVHTFDNADHNWFTAFRNGDGIKQTSVHIMDAISEIAEKEGWVDLEMGSGE